MMCQGATHLGLWICEDDSEPTADNSEVDLGQGPKPAGYYVRSPLFPAPYPQDHPSLDRVCSLFHMLGVFVGKSLQDQRLVDLPLALPFFKMMCQGATHELEQSSQLLKSASLISLTESETSRFSEDTGSDISSVPTTGDKPAPPLTIEDAAASHSDQLVSDTSSESSLVQTGAKPSWFAGILNSGDLAQTQPYLARFLDSLEQLAEQKKGVLGEPGLSDAEKQSRLDALTLCPNNAADSTSGVAGCRLQDLCLDFQFSAPSKVYGYSTYDLKVNGGDVPLTVRNVEEYVDLSRSFALDLGIRKQMESFRAGFTEVFPMSAVRGVFSPAEVRLLLCGEMNPEWTEQDLLNFTQPKFGYTRESPTFQRLVEILVEMDGPQRKKFLQFATGCSSLPPGGLANLQPRLTVVRKEGGCPRGGDTALPSVNTCVHYLKLPEYSSKEVMRAKLLQSTQEKGFHLN